MEQMQYAFDSWPLVLLYHNCIRQAMDAFLLYWSLKLYTRGCVISNCEYWLFCIKSQTKKKNDQNSSAITEKPPV